jgi:hypothetical protein
MMGGSLLLISDAKHVPTGNGAHMRESRSTIAALDQTCLTEPVF